MQNTCIHLYNYEHDQISSTLTFCQAHNTRRDIYDVYDYEFICSLCAIAKAPHRTAMIFDGEWVAVPNKLHRIFNRRTNTGEHPCPLFCFTSEQRFPKGLMKFKQ